MNKQTIIDNMRQLAENEYHSRLRNIETEVDARYHQYQMDIALIDEAERRCLAGFAAMRKAAADRNGLVLETESALATNKQEESV